jgi:hypothetical protein
LLLPQYVPLVELIHSGKGSTEILPFYHSDVY